MDTLLEMGLFDDLKKRISDKVAERAAEIAAERSKAAAEAFAKQSLASAKGLGRKLEEGLFGPRESEDSPADEGSKAAKTDGERQAGERLRAAAKSNAARDEASRRDRAEREARAKKADEEVDAELAALKARLKK